MKPVEDMTPEELRGNCSSADMTWTCTISETFGMCYGAWWTCHHLSRLPLKRGKA